MDNQEHQTKKEPDAEQVDKALKAFWEGSTEEMKRLLDEPPGEPSVVDRLREMITTSASRDRIREAK